MKKVLFLIFITFLGISFSSCSSSDDPASENQKIQNEHENYLIGRWKVVGGGSGGGVYNPKFKIVGDCYLELTSDKKAKCTGEATAYGYYEGSEPFLTNDVKEDLSFSEWSLQYSDVTGFSFYAYKSEFNLSGIHDIDFEDDGTIKLWYLSTYNRYYTLKKVG